MGPDGVTILNLSHHVQFRDSEIEQEPRSSGEVCLTPFCLGDRLDVFGPFPARL
jgi:hypothetical protein